MCYQRVQTIYYGCGHLCETYTDYVRCDVYVREGRYDNDGPTRYLEDYLDGDDDCPLCTR